MEMKQTQQQQRRSYVAGVLLLLGAGLLWSLNGALIKLTFQNGTGPHGVVIAFYRSLFAGLCLLPLLRGRFHTLARRRPSTAGGGVDNADTATAIGGWRALLCLRPAALWCVVFFTLMTVCFVVANTKTEAANAIILQYTSTFWIFGLSPLVLSEKPKAKDLGLLGVAISGIVIIFLGNAETDLPGLLNGLGAGLFFGLLTLMIRRMRDSDSAAVTVLNNLGSALLILPFAWLVGDLMVSTRSLILLVIMGVVQFGVPYYLYTLGLVRVPAYQAALLTMVEPILVPAWTFLSVGEVVPPMTVIGGGVILVALVLFVRRGRRASAVAALNVAPPPDGGEA